MKGRHSKRKMKRWRYLILTHNRVLRDWKALRRAERVSLRKDGDAERRDAREWWRNDCYW